MPTQEEYTNNRFSHITELDDEDLIETYFEVAQNLDFAQAQIDDPSVKGEAETDAYNDRNNLREELAFILRTIEARGLSIGEDSIGEQGEGKSSSRQ